MAIKKKLYEVSAGDFRADGMPFEFKTNYGRLGLNVGKKTVAMIDFNEDGVIQISDFLSRPHTFVEHKLSKKTMRKVV